ncbi:HNH endonuclease signature motif containing protein, partial [Streptomyces sp. SID13726]|uniref:HNH endonuclease n=1 Tax=Streptomyces sp. SID13726 TaxID=2706058 RepID=UPI0013BADFDF
MSDRIPRISRSALWRAGFIEAQGFRCHYCNRPGGPTIGPDARAWHVDHKDPLADGGEDSEDNLALACKRCNIAKGTQPYRHFRAYASVAFWCAAPEPAAERDLDALL